MRESLRATFRSLRIRNYRLYFYGQLVSLSGTWMQTVAMAWLVLRLSHNGAVAVGVVTALQQLPTLLFGAWAGALADRMDKRAALVGTQTVMAIMAAALAIVTFSGTATIFNVSVLAFLTGCGNALDIPARQALVSELVDREDLVNAVALNSAAFNASRVTGPAMAGVLIVTVGTAWCFALNAVSFVAVIGGLLAMRAHELGPSNRVARAKGQVREGLRYIVATPSLVSNLALVALVSMVGLNFPVILPVLAKVSLHGDAGTYSVMTVAMGLGALVGALFVAQRTNPTAQLMAWGSVAFGASMCAAAAAPSAVSMMPLLFLVGVFSIVALSTSYTLLQLESRAGMRGRVMAVRAVTVVGSTPIGAPIAGFVCQHFGARWGLGGGGAATLVITAWYIGYLRRHVVADDVEPAGAPAVAALLNADGAAAS
jgi:MFS family permease